jgi:hypothetical protein
MADLLKLIGDNAQAARTMPIDEIELLAPISWMEALALRARVASSSDIVKLIAESANKLDPLLSELVATARHATLDLTKAIGNHDKKSAVRRY